MPSYRNQSIDLQSKSIDWFLYDDNFGIYWVNALNCSPEILLHQNRKDIETIVLPFDPSGFIFRRILAFLYKDSQAASICYVNVKKQYTNILHVCKCFCHSTCFSRKARSNQYHFRGVFRNLTNIYDGTFFALIVTGWNLWNIFEKKDS